MMNAPSLIEIGTTDTAATHRFMAALFGWTFEAFGPEGEGWFASPTLRIGMNGRDPEPGLVVFFAVPDLDAAMAQVRALGGTTEEPSPWEPGFGRFCTCRDPAGLRFGLQQPAV